MAFDAMGNLYVAATDQHVILRVTPDGIVSVFAGYVGVSGNPDYAGDGTTANTYFQFPRSVAVDGNGFGGFVMVDPMASTAIFDGSVGSAAGLAVDFSNGEVYVADKIGHKIVKWTPPVFPATNGTSTVIAGINGAAGYLDATGTASRSIRSRTRSMSPTRGTS